MSDSCLVGIIPITSLMLSIKIVNISIQIILFNWTNLIEINWEMVLLQFCLDLLEIFYVHIIYFFRHNLPRDHCIIIAISTWFSSCQITTFFWSDFFNNLFVYSTSNIIIIAVSSAQNKIFVFHNDISVFSHFLRL